MGKIKQPEVIQFDRNVSLGTSALIASLGKIDYPIFCFRHLHPDYDLDRCVLSDVKFSKQFLKKIQLLSSTSWNDLQFSDHHGHGTEKISISSINKPIPSSITEDVKDFLSFRFYGTNGRIIGFKTQAIFHVVYVDTKLDVYCH